MITWYISLKTNDEFTMLPKTTLEWKNIIMFNDSNKDLVVIKEGDNFYTKTKEGEASLRVMEVNI